MTEWRFSDGGRAAAGYKGEANDCAVRAAAIATNATYKEAYQALHAITLDDPKVMARLERRYGARARAHASPRHGVYRDTLDKYLKLWHGFVWVPTMQVGGGCQVHLCAQELPHDRLIVRVSRHYAAFIYGTLEDTRDCSRYGTRCVYGYWRPRAQEVVVP